MRHSGCAELSMAYRRVSFFVRREVREFAAARDNALVLDLLNSVGPWPEHRPAEWPRLMPERA